MHFFYSLYLRIKLCLLFQCLDYSKKAIQRCCAMVRSPDAEAFYVKYLAAFIFNNRMFCVFFLFAISVCFHATRAHDNIMRCLRGGPMPLIVIYCSFKNKFRSRVVRPCRTMNICIEHFYVYIYCSVRVSQVV